MSADPTDATARRARRLLWISIACAALFIANVVAGKVALVMGWNLAPPLDGTPEFLLLLVAVAFFMSYTLLKERRHRSQHNPHT